jgi:hypothetical protein
VLAVAALTALVFSQAGCGMGGLFGGGGNSGIEVGIATPGTKIYLDGSYIGIVAEGKPGPIAYVPAGSHTLVAKAPGYEPVQMTVTGFAGRVESYDLPLMSDMTPEKAAETKKK